MRTLLQKLFGAVISCRNQPEPTGPQPGRNTLSRVCPSLHTKLSKPERTCDDRPTQDRSFHEVALSCAAGSGSVVEVPTVFVMRDRGGNVAHDMELVSMLFAGLAVLQLEEVRVNF